MIISGLLEYQMMQIVLYKENLILICHVDKHDEAYEWAKRRRVSSDTKSNSAKLYHLMNTKQKKKNLLFFTK